MSGYRCYKSECIKIWCRIFSVQLVLVHSAIIIKILFCMVFYCALIEDHVFRGIKLLLNLFAIEINDSDTKRKTLRYFYLYIIVINTLAILLYGIVSTSPAKKDKPALIDHLWFLVTNIIICFINLLQNSAFLILIVFIGIDDNVSIQIEAAFLSGFEILQIITLALLVSTFNVRYSEIQKEKSLLFTARLVENNSNKDPLLVC